MVNIASSYPTGQSLTQGSGFVDPSAALVALMQAEAQKRLAPKPAPSRQPMRRSSSSRTAKRPTVVNDPLAEEVRQAEANARIAAARAAVAEARAVSEPPPLKPMIGGPGMIVGPRSVQNDINRMTGAQRQVFLPKDSRMGAIGPSAASLSPQAPAAEETSPHGYDYTNPIDQRRALLALQRGGK